MRVLYGVQGEGLGHAARSKVVIDHLTARGHEVTLITNNRSTRYLGQFYPVHDTVGAHFITNGGAIDYWQTARSNAQALAARGLESVRLVDRLVREERPELVITDFEPLTAYASLRHKLPLLTIDRQHVLTNCQLDAQGLRSQLLLGRAVTRAMVPRADAHIISTFHDAPIKEGLERRTRLVGPILRAEALTTAPSEGEHLLSYVNNPDVGAALLPLLARLDRPVTAYGFGDHMDGHMDGHPDGYANVTFKRPSTRGFLEDLANASAVIAGAGNVLAGEALHFGKPLFAIPQGRQVEQALVARYVERHGYGLNGQNLARLDEFLARRDEFAAQIPAHRFADNERFYSTLDETMRSLQHASR